MDLFEFDLWTPNSTTFKFKLVDFGADSAFGGGNDKEHELTVTPTLNGWNHISVPIASFTGLTTKEHIADKIEIIKQVQMNRVNDLLARFVSDDENDDYENNYDDDFDEQQ